GRRPHPRVQEVPGRRDGRSCRGADVLHDDVAVPGAAGRRLAAGPARRQVARARRRRLRARQRRAGRGDRRARGPADEDRRRHRRCRVDCARDRHRDRAVRRVGRVRRGRAGAQPSLRRRGVARLRRAQARRHRLHDPRHRAGDRRARVGVPRRQPRGRPLRHDRPRRHGGVGVAHRALGGRGRCGAGDLRDRLRAGPRPRGAAAADHQPRRARRRRDLDRGLCRLLLVRLELRPVRRNLRRVRGCGDPAAVAVHLEHRLPVRRRAQQRKRPRPRRIVRAARARLSRLGRNVPL
ncbi:MAG: Ribonuclease BN, partial [uncultured Solirubrobacteraceae bacterium]